MTKWELGGGRRVSLPPGHKHAQTLTYESADPTQMCLPCQGTATQFTTSKQVWDVGTTFVSLGSQRPGGGSQKYPRCSALGNRQEEEVELEGVGRSPHEYYPRPSASFFPSLRPVIG